MRHLLPLTSLLALLAAPKLEAQLIYISHPAVRTAYNVWVPGCVDGSGYLNASFPGVATFDGANPTINSFSGGPIEGLDAFTALRRFNVYGDATNGDITLQSVPPQVEILWVLTGGSITWPAIPSTLRDLFTSGSSTELPPLPAGLLALRVYDMDNLDALPPLPPGLTDLSFGGLNMNVPFPDISGLDLQRLQVRFMSDFTMPDLPSSLRNLSLVYVYLPDNLTLPADLDTLELMGFVDDDFPELPPSLINLTTHDYVELNGVWWTLPELPATLQKLDLWQCSINYLPALPSSLLELVFMNGSSVSCLPPLPLGLQVLVLDQTGVTCLPNIPPGCLIQLWEYEPNQCSILGSTCGAVSANVEGQVFRDLDVDGVQDTGEPASNFVQINVAPIGLAGGIPVDGHYQVQLPPGDYTITATPASPHVQAILPSFHTASLADETSTDTDNNFGLDLATANDLAVTIVTDAARPGFNNEVWVNVRNLGTEVADASVHFTADADQSWVASDVVPGSLVGNTATWTLAAMAMGEMRSIEITLHTDPAVTPGTALDHLASVDPPVGDVDENNNTVSSQGEVVASVDPNDKSVSPSVIDASDLATAEFTYTIRFQNTGTYHAERVIITDTLSASLDWSSFHFVASSHTCNWTLYNGVLRFTFEPIYLPDSTSDEPGSHGFVSFTMKPDVTAGLGPIGNIANIYFDYNTPVITNEAVVDISTGTPMPERTGARLFPIPAQELLWIQRIASGKALASVIDAQGRTLLTRGVNGTTARLDVGELPPGAYVLELRSDSIERIPFLKQ